MMVTWIMDMLQVNRWCMCVFISGDIYGRMHICCLSVCVCYSYTWSMEGRQLTYNPHWHAHCTHELHACMYVCMYEAHNTHTRVQIAATFLLILYCISCTPSCCVLSIEHDCFCSCLLCKKIFHTEASGYYTQLHTYYTLTLYTCTLTLGSQEL